MRTCAALEPDAPGDRPAPRCRGPRRMSGRARRARRSARSLPLAPFPTSSAPGLRVVFCGINPGFVSAAAEAHFANPRNDFWRLLHAAGFTSRLYEPAEQFEVLREGIGLTNAAPRTTRGSGDLRRADFAGSAERLERLARGAATPGWIAFVGKEAYRGAFNERPELGLQERRLGDTRLFVLPSTSPANAAVPWAERLRWFQELAGRATGRPLRQAVRALRRRPADGRVLLVASTSRSTFRSERSGRRPAAGSSAGRPPSRRCGASSPRRRASRRSSSAPASGRASTGSPGCPGWGGQSRADLPRPRRRVRAGAAG